MAAIDQGTTSTRCILFDHDAQVVAGEQVEHRQSFPRAAGSSTTPPRSGPTPAASSAARWPGPTSRCTTSPRSASPTSARRPSCGTARTGDPIAPAIVWQDTRTQAICDELGDSDGGAGRYRDRVGLPLATYFAGPKVRWLLDNVDGARARAEDGELAFGTIDSWLLWNLTGGPDGGVHVTDVTNASRTHADGSRHPASGRPRSPTRWACRWRCCPRSARRRRCTRRCASAGRWPGCRSPASSATSRQPPSARPASTSGEAKNTYGTGNFLLLNTGTEQVLSEHGLLTTSATSSATRRRCTRSRGRSRSPARWCSGCATTSA